MFSVNVLHCVTSCYIVLRRVLGWFFVFSGSVRVYVGWGICRMYSWSC